MFTGEFGRTGDESEEFTESFGLQKGFYIFGGIGGENAEARAVFAKLGQEFFHPLIEVKSGNVRSECLPSLGKQFGHPQLGDAQMLEQFFQLKVSQ